VSTSRGKPIAGGASESEGRSDLRGVMVEAAWVAVEHHPHWKAQFERLAARIGKQKAIVAIARKLLVVIWHVLRKPGSRLPCTSRGGHPQIAALD
jgi:transposase